MKSAAYTPREIVHELDRHIVGQLEAKRAVAIALRNRWRRQQLDEALAEEVTPKNILMIGPTGCGKTEIARRLAKLADAPFTKIEATKFTEVGYVGRDVESIIRDLVEVGIKQTRDTQMKSVRAAAEDAAEDRVLDVFVGATASEETRQKFRKKLRQGDLDDKEIEIEVLDKKSGLPTMDIPGMPGGQVGMLDLGDLLGSKGRPTKRKMAVKTALEAVTEEEADKRLDQESLQSEAISSVENNGIVFIDEIDKIAISEQRGGGAVSREGVQRDLLPLIEGTQVSTKHGIVKTDHILFIASGAFHLSKPSDLLPELQGRLPIRVELTALSKEDFRRILADTEHSLLKQYRALLGTEGLSVKFSEEAIDRLAELSFNINESVENIGARRLATVMERLLEDISFSAPDKGEDSILIDRALVDERVGILSDQTDLSRFIL